MPSHAVLLTPDAIRCRMRTILPPCLAPRAVHTSVLIILASTLLATSAVAQTPKERHRIVIEPGTEACVYRIHDQVNQDVFVTRPGGAVVFRALRGLWVDISVEDAPGAVPGTQHRRALALRTRTPQNAFTVRGGRGQTTEHRVRIQCCLNRTRGPGCPQWTDAVPHVPAPDPGGNALWLGPRSALRGHGPAPQVAPPPFRASPTVPPGGPVMRVEEEQ